VTWRIRHVTFGYLISWWALVVVGKGYMPLPCRMSVLGASPRWMRKDGTLVTCSHCRHGQDNTVLSCPCRLCEQAIMQHFLIRYWLIGLSTKWSPATRVVGWFEGSKRKWNVPFCLAIIKEPSISHRSFAISNTELSDTSAEQCTDFDLIWKNEK